MQLTKKIPLFIMLLLLSVSSFSQWDSKYDLDGNEIVDLSDFSQLALHWLETPYLEMPAVFGLDKNEAENVILNAGLRIGSLSEQHSLSFPDGTVISQYPLAGRTVSSGEAVALTVSTRDQNRVSGMSWVYISDPNFTGYMSKYETTNQQYCDFLNDAYIAGKVEIIEEQVFAAGGNYSGKIYYDMSDSNAQIDFSSGYFYVQTRNGFNMADHPVTKVSWYGAKAFCNFYGFSLPTLGQWEGTADYDGTFDFGCGEIIDHSRANYARKNPLGLSHYPYTTPAGHYPAHGYGLCDMAGNAWEWTLTSCADDKRIAAGGGWFSYDGKSCSAANTYCDSPENTISDTGFRAVKQQ
ncbi:SUMF1/EgtB/PvdO family nonheme iron enzyme [Sedimentisphaera salicampi]|uniref:Serine/threonine-protein kinase pkn1 n=1 Tax=Sedimentisphaera salicampi TaxID=1941349 RepID=A0A1W6LLS4_9BACT|nr:SUMF1/EgtB/PvdO family nonheme iron enzyme [Sedimentisphaera salicampi]ARN56702.1 Serine/threonine-protein kinase pkn1 [Sedimentisphaera salicampi]OXU15142.1 Serine/threonine-protein kinase pkn1 [Sedimentisphaera salicampi]